MLKSNIARVLTTVSLIPLGFISSPLAAQSSGATQFRGFAQQPSQVAAVNLVEVGITDIVERTAVGTVEEQVRDLQITDTIFFDEIISTGPNSATRVSFLDDSSLSLGPSSQVVIDRFIYDPAQGTGEMALSLTAGVFRFASGTIEDNNYTIDTPVGTIGIRGTEIEVVVRCVQRAVGDCEVSMDVVSGFTTFDGSDELNTTPTGSRMHFRPIVSPVVEIAELPSNAAPLPGLEEMGRSINQSTVELIEGALPNGVSFATATPAQLAAAAVRLASQNPRVADLIIEAVAASRQDALGEVTAALLANVPGSSRRVETALANINDEKNNSIPGRIIDDEEPDVQETQTDDNGDGDGDDNDGDVRDAFDDARDAIDDARDDIRDSADDVRDAIDQAGDVISGQ